MDSLATIIAQHTKIADAIERGSERDATQAMHEHLRKIFPLVPELLRKFPEYFEEGGKVQSGRVYRPDLSQIDF